jgi:hypothetical protein
LDNDLKSHTPKAPRRIIAAAYRDELALRTI